MRTTPQRVNVSRRCSWLFPEPSGSFPHISRNGPFRVTSLTKVCVGTTSRVSQGGWALRARISVDTDSIRNVGTQLGNWAPVIGGSPVSNRPSLASCGSSVVSNAGSSTEDQFRIQRLIIEAELLELTTATQVAANAFDELDRNGAAHHGSSGGGAGGGGGGGW